MGNDVKVKFTASTTGIEKGIGRVKSLVGGLGKTIGLVMAPLAALGGAAAFGAGVVMASKAAASFETLAIQLEVLTGSAEKAGALLKEIVEYGSTTPLEQSDLQAAVKTLLAFNMATEEVMPTLRMLGEISMGNGEKLQQLALIYGKVSSAGRLMSDDVNQMIDAGFNPLTYIAEKLGINMVDMKKQVERGAVSVSMLRDSLQTATGAGGKFHNMLGRISETTEGKFSNLSDTFEALKIAFGTTFNSQIKATIDVLITSLGGLKNEFSKWGGIAGSMVATITNAFKNGTFWSTIWNGLLYVLQKAGEYMLSIGELVGQKIGQAIEPYIPESMRPDTPPSGSSWEFLKYKYNGFLGSKDSADALAWNTRSTTTKEDSFASEITKAASSLKEKLKSGNTFKEFTEPLQWTLDLKLNDLKSDKPVSSYQPQGFKAVADSLTRIGGGGLSMTANPLVSLQTKANNYLSTIARNTLQQPSSVWQ